MYRSGASYHSYEPAVGNDHERTDIECGRQYKAPAHSTDGYQSTRSPIAAMRLRRAHRKVITREEDPREGGAALVLGHHVQRQAGIAQIRQAWLPAKAYGSYVIAKASCRHRRQASCPALRRRPVRPVAATPPKITGCGCRTKRLWH